MKTSRSVIISVFLIQSSHFTQLSKVMILYLCFQAQPVILRTILRQNETLSTYLKDDLSVSPAVVQSLMNAEIHLNPVSIISQREVSSF